MTNVVAGSEAAFVKVCQSAYPTNKGWDTSSGLSNCTLNALHLVSDYDLILLQEANRNVWPLFEKVLKQVGTSKGKTYSSHYHRAQIAVVYNTSILGNALSLEPPGFVFGDYRGVATDRRGMQILYFQDKGFVVINLHAPHKIDLSRSISGAIAYACSNKVVPAKRILVGGDFNDDSKSLVNPRTPTIKALGFSVFMPTLNEPLDVNGYYRSPATCCHDANYIFPGDYILDSSPPSKSPIHYDYPKGYSRQINHVSDHDPIVYTINLS